MLGDSLSNFHSIDEESESEVEEEWEEVIEGDVFKDVKEADVS